MLRKHPIFAILNLSFDPALPLRQAHHAEAGATLFSKEIREQSLCGDQRHRENEHLLSRWPQRDFQPYRPGEIFGESRCSMGSRGPPTHGKYNCEIFVIDRENFCLLYEAIRSSR